ncbi:L-fucose mutarotase [Paenibacillus xerothermodurans]|uniref:L-fucose mutarotase n=1 Tax=Paenibacillus xerothermodurans TaxID=1977292 RepID=A0A2W1NX87_PAEXE|nr:L-fucose mutarotase [Paenibacillus xerothermodurans]PZE22336.1 L-fucose mutarotase [Paenibacillus xerothermodurans]
MLTGIPSVISPDLLKIMMEMGHGDELILADGNFPAAACARRLVRADGLGIVPLLDAVLRLFPLDTYVKEPVALMQVVPGDPTVPTVWEQYEQVLANRAGAGIQIEQVERFAFYERAKRAYAIVATGETSQYANIILTKGVVKEGGSL